MKHSLYEEERITKVAYDHKIARKLYAYLKPYLFGVIVSLLLLFLTAGMELLGPYLTKLAIDNHIARGKLEGLSNIIILYFSLLVASFIIKYIRFYIMALIGQKVMFDLRTKIFSHLQELSLKYFDRNPIGRLLTRVTSDVEVLNDLFGAGVVEIFGSLLTVIGIIIAMLLLDYRLALACFTVLPLLIYTSFLFRKKVRLSYLEIRRRLAKINAFLQEHITGMGTVRLFSQEEQSFKKFDQLNFEYYQEFLRTIFYYAVFYPAIEIISSLAIALVIWYGGGQVLQGQIQLGVLVAFFEYTQRFFHPVRELSEKYNLLQAAMASSERIFDLIETPPAITDIENPIVISDFQGGIEFKNVWHAYSGDDYVLKDISFKISPGEKVAIVGATGAGKTTIISLLSRFYEQRQGEILVDGVDIRRYAQEDYRRHIGIILQDVFIFTGSISDNIALGRDIPCERIREAAEYVNADKFIEKLPGKYDEIMKERGANLSVGQKQLLSFARALAVNPHILIIDEATSSVDTETESLIQEALTHLLENRTSIIIAHRLSTIQHVDRILVMHKGRLKEQGSHAELLRRQGLYYKLHQLQYQGGSIAGLILIALCFGGTFFS